MTRQSEGGALTRVPNPGCWLEHAFDGRRFPYRRVDRNAIARPRRALWPRVLPQAQTYLEGKVIDVVVADRREYLHVPMYSANLGTAQTDQ